MRTLPQRSGGLGVRTQAPNAVRRVPKPHAQRAKLAWSERSEDNPATPTTIGIRWIVDLRGGASGRSARTLREGWRDENPAAAQRRPWGFSAFL